MDAQKVRQTKDVQEIKHAVKIHDYIENLEKLTKLSLKSSPIILGLPSQKIILEIPKQSKPCYEYVEQLYEDISDHDLLFKAMKTGWQYINSNYKKITKTKEEYFQQLNSSHGFHVAKERGYLIPDSLLRKKQFCYGQYEAYYGVHEIFYGNALGIWLSKSNFYNMHSYAEIYENVKLITSQFIVPSSVENHSTPYMLDQLWVVSHAVNQVRLLGLEIAGEHHFFNGLQSKTFGEEKYLKKLGYEMYQLASWWCRVDPYRVISEFLSVSGIFPDAINHLIGSELNSIDKYVCGVCGAPMVRWGWDWIQECKIGNSTLLAHKHCANLD